MATPARLAQSSILTPQHVADFHRDGFVVVPAMFAADETRRITAWIDEVQGYPEVPGRYMMYFEESLVAPGARILQRVENIYPYHRDLAALFDGDRLRGAAGELFGEPAILFKEKINFKLPGGDGFKPHQDQQAGWWNYAELFITALLSIDEATPGKRLHRHRRRPPQTGTHRRRVDAARRARPGGHGDAAVPDQAR